MERFLEDNADLRNHVIRADGKIIKVQLPFSAREVYLKTNARIFGLELAQNITAKVIRTQSRSIILKEIAARRQLSGHLSRSPYVSLPMVYDYGETGNWLVEELVHGTRITTEDFSRFLADGGARDFYGASVRMATVGGSPQTIDLARKLTVIAGHQP